MKCLPHGVSTIVIALLLGCGTSGPTAYEISGQVTHNGQAVPAGYIRFVPDTAQGNDGPAARATIKDGFYQTPTGKGIVGGPYTVTVYGFDGVPFVNEEEGRTVDTGRALFPPHKLLIDLPAEAAVRDINVE